MTNKNIDKSNLPADFNGNFTKIFVSDKGIPFIAYNSVNSQCTKEIKVKGDKEPKDSYFSALNALKPFYVDFLEIEHKLDDTKIIGVSFDDTGIVISGLVKLTRYDFPTPVCINSPHIFYENKTGGFAVTKEVKGLLNTIKNEAIAYMSDDTKYIQGNFIK